MKLLPDPPRSEHNPIFPNLSGADAYEIALLRATSEAFYASRPATTALGDGPVVTGDPVVDAWERELWENPPDDDSDDGEDDP